MLEAFLRGVDGRGRAIVTAALFVTTWGTAVVGLLVSGLAALAWLAIGTVACLALRGAHRSRGADAADEEPVAGAPEELDPHERVMRRLAALATDADTASGAAADGPSPSDAAG